MMQALAIGQSNSVTWIAEKKYCIERGPGLWVFSTPSLVWLMERACTNLLVPAQVSEETSVGTLVMVRHLAASALGASLTATATLVEIDRRRFRFEVVVVDEVERVGEGEHERFIVNVAKYEERIRAK